jgi:hypothetical protein
VSKKREVMSGIFCEFEVGRSGVGTANARYITRERATLKDSKGLVVHNYPEHIGGEEYDQIRRVSVEYNRQREEFEVNQRRRGKGELRTHYRCKLSFEGRVETEKASRMTKEWLEKSFPKARAVAAVHQNTRHTHVHVNIQVRQIDGKKIQLKDEHYRNLDSKWARIYGREFGREKERMHEDKKREMQEWKREYREAKARGEKPSRPKPQRVEKRVRGKEERAREYGIDQIRTGRDQRRTATEDTRARAGERGIGRESDTGGRTEQAINSLARASEEFNRKASQTVRGAEQAVRGVEQTVKLRAEAVRGSEQAVRGAQQAIRGTEQLRTDLKELAERSRGREEGGIER